MTNSKTCTKCNETKTLDAFHKDSKAKDNLRNICKPCAKVSANKWHSDNPERTRSNDTAWYYNNKEYKIAKVQSYLMDNPVRAAAHDSKKTAVRRSPNCIPDNFDFEATLPLYAERIRLTKETGVEHHVDHIVALVNGGLHEASNLQVITADENLKKATTERT